MPNGGQDPDDPLRLKAMLRGGARITDLTAPEGKVKGLTKELVQLSRVTHLAHTIGVTTDAIISCNDVFKDKESSDLAKAAAAMRCIAKIGQVAALCQPVGIVITACLDMLTAILDAASPHSESLI